MSDNELQQWTNLVAQIENVTDYKTQVQGNTNKDDGYLSTITFLTLNGRTSTGQKKDINIVIKASKQNPNYREKFSIDTIFGKEIYIYNEVNPAFEAFFTRRGIKLPAIVPKCYIAQKTEVNEIIVLENLKSINFVLHDRKTPMSFDYVKIMLEGFAQWHAYSLALKYHELETFQKLTQNNINMFAQFFTKGNMFQYISDMLGKAKSTTTSPEVLKHIDWSLEQIKYYVTEMIHEDPNEQVILHGDCWTNNFMFKLNDKSQPTEMRLLDWQCSGLASPVCDLSFFLYCCASDEDNRNLENLLRIYHNALSKFLDQLGCSSEEIFSYKKLLQHWKKYARYGFLISNFILRFSLCDAEEAPDFAEELAQGKKFIDIFYFKLQDEEKYLKRVGNNLVNYVKSMNIN